ncbi:hypothetical protein [Curtobacterium sp. MCBA15_001]|uniref:hypothetical protein n=1 Tax=Curtobacterium sp. MCBA15_001 TaxID=1898731 RepID=UPI0008DCF28F|nr:hypothetical protein [Curtobacterium sp. MCBA15_001]OIH92582.1 hypothetical protein BIU90_12030 [Curtobacterium sp. MCBA15_001]
MDGAWIGWAGVVVSVVSACAAVGATVVTLREGRAMRRNTEFLAHRDQWWQRWAWIADRALCSDEDANAAASLMVHALTTRRWVTEDDNWVLRELERRETDPATQRRRDDDDLRPE